MDYNNLNEELIEYIMLINKFFIDNNISLQKTSEEFVIDSDDKKCQFILNTHRGGEYSNRIVFNLRYRKSDEMVFRLEIDGKPHVNSDGTLTDRDHVHINQFKDGKILQYGISLKDFKGIIIQNTSDICEVFEEFCKYNKIQIPEYQRTM
ncbi:hypothetical protein HMPREF9225_0091 [Peptoniphilus duerdenii ATCC BAA-1640]|uniref:Uncharacterized protein n=1 Tax=Peptoniphilus duerdenii ATCC BAA-1640 TaxID=862517 RepID=E0NIV2_9FIRM|nr:hypothetical protein [Peptoniphilus duerdenii]EFM26282.1 hypothetical protein HMPREF9225_0091 [Peptoniphilus duerdenii ATCC BAA-1640]